MGIFNALTELGKTVAKFSTDVSNAVKGTYKSAGNPTQWTEKLTGNSRKLAQEFGEDILYDNLLKPIVDRIKPKPTKPPFTEEKIPLGDLVEKEVLVEVVCIDRKTGTASTHTFLVKYSQLHDILANPQKAIQDSGDEGCSGTPGTDVDIVASVVG